MSILFTIIANCTQFFYFFCFWKEFVNVIKVLSFIVSNKSSYYYYFILVGRSFCKCFNLQHLEFTKEYYVLKELAFVYGYNLTVLPFFIFQFLKSSAAPCLFLKTIYYIAVNIKMLSIHFVVVYNIFFFISVILLVFN